MFASLHNPPDCYTGHGCSFSLHIIHPVCTYRSQPCMPYSPTRVQQPASPTDPTIHIHPASLNIPYPHLLKIIQMQHYQSSLNPFIPIHNPQAHPMHHLSTALKHIFNPPLFYQCVQSVLDATSTQCQLSSVQLSAPGMTSLTSLLNTSTKPCKSRTWGLHSALPGSGTVAAVSNMTTCINVQDVKPSHMVLANALKHRECHPQTPIRLMPGSMHYDKLVY